MDERLKEAYQKIYEGEAKAVLRLKLFAKQADKEDLPQIAKLFRVVAFSEEIHGERSLRMLREIRDTEHNLKDRFDSEFAVAGVAYDQFLKVAAKVGDTPSSPIFSHSRDVEDIHAALYKKAMSHLMEEKDAWSIAPQVNAYLFLPGFGLCQQIEDHAENYRSSQEKGERNIVLCLHACHEELSNKGDQSELQKDPDMEFSTAKNINLCMKEFDHHPQDKKGSKGFYHTILEIGGKGIIYIRSKEGNDSNGQGHKPYQ
jgi:rubrerythrin